MRAARAAAEAATGQRKEGGGATAVLSAYTLDSVFGHCRIAAIASGIISSFEYCGTQELQVSLPSPFNTPDAGTLIWGVGRAMLLETVTLSLPD